jgi:PAS domain S-box-containing protein
MAAGKKKPEVKNTDTPGNVRSLRDNAEEQLARSPKRSPDLTGQKARELIHELQVHQIELETQAEELRRVQLVLEESRDKYLDLYDFAPIGYLTLSGEALIDEVNLTGATLLGVGRSRLVNTRFRKFIAPEDLDMWDRYFVNVLNQVKKQSRTLMLMRGDGSTFPARLESIRIADTSKGNPTVRVAISDITDIRQMEIALQVSNKKLNLLSSITRHDISNQVLVLDGYLTILEKKLPHPTFTEYFRKAATAVHQISSMIRFTKEYQDIGVNAPVWLDIRTLIGTAAKEAQSGKVMVENDLPPHTEVFADPLIVKVFYNLMDNAVKYGGRITTIRFSVRDRNGDLVFVCEDDGGGIPAEEKEKIFERGFGKNTGLGLALSREILSITGITITETGEPGKGARFEISVPKGTWRMAGANLTKD